MNGPELSASLRTSMAQFDPANQYYPPEWFALCAALDSFALTVDRGPINNSPHMHVWCVTRRYADSKAERCECSATRLVYDDGRAHSGHLP
jgi:hypothetical protein